MSIGDNYCRVMEGIASACAASGRSTEDVKLIAVTKFVPVERIAEAVAAGARRVGENRAQELRDKLAFFEENGLEAHLIGQLQTNKVKYAIGKVSLIQSVDRLQLAEEISRLAVQHSLTQGVLVEVNIGGEEQKGGVPKGELFRLLEMISALPGVRVKGLMCVPPAMGGEAVRGCFAEMRELFCRAAGLNLPNVDMQELSMGMSGDYKFAVMEGATMVRVGSALFGARPQAAAKA